MFKPVSSVVDFPALEEEITKFWKENRIFQKSIDNRPEDNTWTFVDGPPFVSGLPHYGHLLVSIAKDMIPRYQTMMGKRVRRVFGWDCHGLPIEAKVNSLLDIKTHDQVEKTIGVEKYVQECRNFVKSCINEWGWYIDKVGRWVDMDNAYYTMDLNFMESVLWMFKQTYEKGLIYKGKRISLFSTDTSTPVSNFEVAMDPDNYREVEDLSIFVKFELERFENFDKVNLLAWTTTPWTIPSNIAVAINENFTYVLVEVEGENMIVAKDRVKFAFKQEVKVIKELKGKELEGLSYKPVYDFFVSPKNENNFKVYLSDFVTNEEGTGVLHISPAFGEVDYQLGQKFNLSLPIGINDEGKMIVGDFKGLHLTDANPKIAKELKENGSVFRIMSYTHRLPFYRGEKPLIYMVQDAYFIDVQKIKGRMLELNQKINWVPKHIKNGRFADTIETSPDWCISRTRFWATIMPIWQAEDGDEIVIGSLNELTQYTDQVTKKEVAGKVKYFFGSEPMDLHRDICDKIILKKDDKEYKRIPEVLDSWMDAGSVPFAEYHYPFENKELFEKSSPADFIIEYVAQVRAWFNILLRVSTITFDDTAFTNALSHGTIAGSDGRKMSKSFGNYPDPKVVLEKYGGEVMRVYFMGSPVMLGEDITISEAEISENSRFLLVFWNSYKFFIDYASLNEWRCSETPENSKEKLTVLDRWILARLTQVVLDIHKAFDSYNTVKVTNTLRDFIMKDFSTWYIRRSRDRVDLEADKEDRDVCLSVMYGVLVTLTKLAAPLIPFITEEMFKNLTDGESVHLTDYPLGDKDLINDDLVREMMVVREIVEAGHAKRKVAEIKLRQPLSSLVYVSSKKLDDELEKLIGEELNVKKVEYSKPDTKANENLGAMVTLDTNITPELQEAGDVRDLMREIQKMRKEMNLTLADKTKIEAPSWPDKYEKDILKGTASISISKGPELRVNKV